MNGCYVDCPNMVNFPFTSEDFFTEHDLDVLHGRVKGDEISGESMNSLSGAVGKNKRHDPGFIKTSTCSWSKNTGKYDTYGTFNGNGIITGHQLKHDVWDWLNESFYEDVFQRIWSAGGTNIPPVTVLCFSLNSGWHNEGPVPHPKFNNQLRPPAVVNFRLLGDVDKSYIEFADPDEKMAQAEQELMEIYLQKVEEGKKHAKYDAELNTVAEHKTMIMSSTITGYYDSYYNNNLHHLRTHHGMHNPYIVNIGKWHRVITNNTPRITLRVHANTNLTFERIEQMVEAGEFFK